MLRLGRSRANRDKLVTKDKLDKEDGQRKGRGSFLPSNVYKGTKLGACDQRYWKKKFRSGHLS